MTKVYFYLLPSDNPNVRQTLACRLTEKAYRRGHKVFIRTESGMQNKTMDDLLWTFRAGSFVPHAIATGNEVDKEVPVILAHETEPFGFDDVLINLSSAIPDGYDRFQRVIELVDQNNSVRDAGRKRYLYYKQQGLELDTHKINSIR